MNNIKVPLIGMGLAEFSAFVVFIVLAYYVWTKVAKATS
jgi:hypothetical protein